MKQATCVGLFLAGILLICGCSKPSDKDVSQTDTHSSVRFATRFDYNQTELIIKEPWPGAKNPQVIKLGKAPERIVVTSTTHLPYLELLGVSHTLVGFPNTNYIYSPSIRELVASGLITDLGPDGNINLEVLLSLNPDLVIAFDMGKESSTLDKISEAGIPVIYNADYLETSILGRAEWIKAFGKIYRKEKEADSIFQSISNNYHVWSAKTKILTQRPTVFSGIMYGDAWFLPGGSNWSAQLLEDAGGAYLWNDDSSNGWLELSFEAVYQKAQKADLWIGTATIQNLDQLIGQDERYKGFEAFRQKNIYNYSKRISPGGGYDFFESGYARPDLVLSDLITILHPELLPDQELYYYERLQ